MKWNTHFGPWERPRPGVLRAASALFVMALSVPRPGWSAEVEPIQASKIILVGDSTTAVIGGWGPSFCADHVTSFAACVNLARGGRSSGSYRAEGSWDLAMAEMRTPGFEHTWVLIQFGHNDQPGKPGRSTDLETEFPANLERYVKEARQAGATPVLLTPLTRRMFKDGKVQNDLAPWAEATRRVAEKTKTPLIDLNASSVAAVEKMGAAAATRFSQVPPSEEVLAAARTGTTIDGSIGAPPRQERPPSDVAGMAPMGWARLSFDYTHLGQEGADYFAKMVTDELALEVPEMRPLLVP